MAAERSALLLPRPFPRGMGLLTITWALSLALLRWASVRRTAAAVFSNPSGAVTPGPSPFSSTRTLETKSTGQVIEKGMSPRTPWASTPQPPGARAVAEPAAGPPAGPAPGDVSPGSLKIRLRVGVGSAYGTGAAGIDSSFHSV